jgi:hypothetical protein
MKEFKERIESSEEVEKTANFEGNDSLLLIERLRNPIIKNQIIDFIQHGYEARAARAKSGFTVQSREEIEVDVETRLSEVENVTKIGFKGLGLGSVGE